jgi:ABC-type sulfate transport system permease component
MTARFDSFTRTVSVFGAVLFTAVCLFASTPLVPIA